MENFLKSNPAGALEDALKSENFEIAKAAESELVERANKGDLKCAEILTSAYSDGEHCIPQNPDKAYTYTEILANGGSSFYQYWLASLCYTSGNYKGALENALKSYNNGSGQGGLLAARMLIEGEGTMGRAHEGFEILEQLIKDSDVEAQLKLAYYLLQGEFIPQDIPRAYEYTSKIPKGYYQARQHSVGVAEASVGYYVLGYSGYLMKQRGRDVDDWQIWIKKAAEMGHIAARKLCDTHLGSSGTMKSTIKGNYEQSQISPGVTEISYLMYRTAFLATFVVGIGFTASIVFMALGIPLLIIGAIATFSFKGRGVLTIITGQGIKFTHGSAVQQVPFSEISRVDCVKLHPWLSVYKVTLDTKGKKVVVAKNVTQPVAQDLQQAILGQ